MGITHSFEVTLEPWKICTATPERAEKNCEIQHAVSIHGS